MPEQTTLDSEANAAPIVPESGTVGNPVSEDATKSEELASKSKETTKKTRKPFVMTEARRESLKKANAVRKANAAKRLEEKKKQRPVVEVELETKPVEEMLSANQLKEQQKLIEDKIVNNPRIKRSKSPAKDSVTVAKKKCKFIDDEAECESDDDETSGETESDESSGEESEAEIIVPKGKQRSKAPVKKRRIPYELDEDDLPPIPSYLYRSRAAKPTLVEQMRMKIIKPPGFYQK